MEEDLDLSSDRILNNNNNKCVLVWDRTVMKKIRGHYSLSLKELPVFNVSTDIFCVGVEPNDVKMITY